MLVAFSPVGSDEWEKVGVGISKENVESEVNAFLEKKGIPAKYRDDGYIKDSEGNRYGFVAMWKDNGLPLNA